MYQYLLTLKKEIKAPIYSVKKYRYFVKTTSFQAPIFSYQFVARKSLDKNHLCQRLFWPLEKYVPGKSQILVKCN